MEKETCLTDSFQSKLRNVRNWKQFVISQLLFFMVVNIVFMSSCTSPIIYANYDESFERGKEVYGKPLYYNVTVDRNSNTPPLFSGDNELIVPSDVLLQDAILKFKIHGNVQNIFVKMDYENSESSNVVFNYFVVTNINKEYYVNVFKSYTPESIGNNFLNMKKMNEITLNDNIPKSIQCNLGKYFIICQSVNGKSLILYNQAGKIINKIEFQQKMVFSNCTSGTEKNLVIFGYDGRNIVFYNIEDEAIKESHRIDLKYNSDINDAIFEDFKSYGHEKAFRQVALYANNKLLLIDIDNFIVLDEIDISRPIEALENRLFKLKNGVKYMVSILDKKIKKKYFTEYSIIDDCTYDLICSYNMNEGYYFVFGKWMNNNYYVTILSNFDTYYNNIKSSDIYRRDFGPFDEKIIGLSNYLKDLFFYSENKVYKYNMQSLLSAYDDVKYQPIIDRLNVIESDSE